MHQRSAVLDISARANRIFAHEPDDAAAGISRQAFAEGR